jgi:hypothetical protein
LIELPVDFVASKSWLKAASNACITTKDSTEMERLKVCARQKKTTKDTYSLGSLFDFLAVSNHSSYSKKFKNDYIFCYDLFYHQIKFKHNL